MDKLVRGKHSQCLVRINYLYCSKFCRRKRIAVMHFPFTFFPGPSELDNFTDDLRGVIPRSFEYLFFLINREAERVSYRILLLGIFCQPFSHSWYFIKLVFSGDLYVAVFFLFKVWPVKEFPL